MRIPTPLRFASRIPQQGEKSAEYIGSHKLATKIGILYDSSDVYSSGIHDSFVENAEKNGLQIVADEQFTADNKTDFNIQLQNIRNSGAELVFLPFYYTEAALVLKQSKDMGYSPIFFGCDGMDGILNLDGFDKSLAEGLMLLTPFSADARMRRRRSLSLPTRSVSRRFRFSSLRIPMTVCMPLRKLRRRQI